MAGIAQNSAGMALGTVLSRVTGVLRDIMMTAALGFFIVSDAYSLGNTLPNIIYILVAGGALNAVFIPQLVRHMKSDDDGGKAFADRLLSAVGVLLLLLSVASVALAPYIVDIYTTSDVSQNEYDLAVAFARLCLPQIFFYGAYTMLQQVLNARGKFAAAMFAPIANNIVAIAVFGGFIAVVRPTADSLATLSSGQVWWLGLGTTFGVALQAAVLLPPLIKSGYKYGFRSDFRGGGLGHAGGLALWTVGLVIANQIGYAVITRLATSANILAEQVGASAAGLTTYQKAHLIFVLPHSVITVSLVTALLPKLSELAHQRDFTELGRQVRQSARVVLALLMPVAALMAVTAPDLTALLFGYGAAGTEAARTTGQVVSVFALGLPAYSLVYVLYRAWYSLEDTKTPFWIALLINVLNLGFALWWFGSVDRTEQIPSLAWAYTLAYSVASLVAFGWLNRRLPGLQPVATAGLALRLLVASAVAAAAAHLLPALGTSMAAMTATLALQWLLGLAVFVALSALLRITEVRKGLGLAISRVRPRRTAA